MRIRLLVLLTAFVMASCWGKSQEKALSVDNSMKTAQAATQKPFKAETTEISCDSVYKNKGYRIILTTFDASNVGN